MLELYTARCCSSLTPMYILIERSRPSDFEKVFSTITFCSSNSLSSNSCLMSMFFSANSVVTVTMVLSSDCVTLFPAEPLMAVSCMASNFSGNTSLSNFSKKPDSKLPLRYIPMPLGHIYIYAPSHTTVLPPSFSTRKKSVPSWRKNEMSILTKSSARLR